MSDLDEATKARIRAEEEFRAQVRGELGKHLPLEPNHGGPACPKCGSTDTRHARAIHEEGMSNLHASTRGVGYGTGGLGVGVTQTNGTQQTNLSRRLAPPQRQDPGTPWLAFWAAVAVGGVALVLALLNPEGAAVMTFWAVFGSAAIVAILAYSTAQWRVGFNRNQLPRLQAQWERTYRCQRCGTIFERA